jgi:hypothetical protein
LARLIWLVSVLIRGFINTEERSNFAQTRLRECSKKLSNEKKINIVTCWNPEETLLWIRWRPLPRK